MPAGDAFTQRQTDEITRAMRLAGEECGLRFSVYVGSLAAADPRGHARTLHAALGDQASGAVLVAVDPGGRRLEIVTGERAHRHLLDRDCGLATLTMTTAFAAGDLTGGILSGVRLLAEHARHPRTLHLER